MSSKESFYNALFEGDVELLEKLSDAETDLPWAAGEIGQDVLVTAIQLSNLNSLTWVLSKKPEINFVDDTWPAAGFVDTEIRCL
ncbi:hypothetical protein [Yoonia sp. SDW83-1]|uniref:hypothetical protein n=1 Tax=Yoonia sp. SDW83-1 TaxID=3366945 RepID=UPI00398C7E2C